MSRRHVSFACEGEQLIGTLDDAAGKIGLLIVSGGNETRAGAFSGQAQLAARIAAEGFPVFRYDRRGVGDSTGTNREFRDSSADISAASAAFQQVAPDLVKIVGFGNCDAASALMLAQSEQFSTLVLANPWTFDADEADSMAPPAAIRSRYADKLKNPRELVRLLTGGVSLMKLAGGLRRALSPPPPPSSLLDDMRSGIAASGSSARYLLAENDRTAQAFMAAWPQSNDAWQICPGAGHSFAEEHARDWLFNQLIGVLHEQTGQLDMR